MVDFSFLADVMIAAGLLASVVAVLGLGWMRRLLSRVALALTSLLALLLAPIATLVGVLVGAQLLSWLGQVSDGVSDAVFYGAIVAVPLLVEGLLLWSVYTIGRKNFPDARLGW